MHIISHGTTGAVRLGSTWLSSDTLAAHAEVLSGWGESLSIDADLLFYGCNLAGSAQGQELVETLADLTGADVAASDDLTGSALLGAGTDQEIHFRLGRSGQWDGGERARGLPTTRRCKRRRRHEAAEHLACGDGPERSRSPEPRGTQDRVPGGVVHGQTEAQPSLARRRPLGGGYGRPQWRGQPVAPPDHAQPNAAFRAAPDFPVEILPQELEEAPDLGRRATPVVGGEREEREDVDPLLHRRLDHAPHGPNPRPVPLRPREAALLCPAAVPVHNDRDVKPDPERLVDDFGHTTVGRGPESLSSHGCVGSGRSCAPGTDPARPFRLG